MLTVHPICRFLLESIRTDEPKMFPFPSPSDALKRANDGQIQTNMSIPQLLSVLILLAACGLWAYLIFRTPRLDGSDMMTKQIAADDAGSGQPETT